MGAPMLGCAQAPQFTLACVPGPDFLVLGQPCREYLVELLISSCALPEDPIATVQRESGQQLELLGLLTLVER